MKKNLLKIFMLVVAFAMNVTGAWAEAENVATLSFADATHPTLSLDGQNGDLGTANYGYSFNGATFLNVWGENNNNGSKIATITSTDLVADNVEWTLEFDWAGYSGCNKRAGYTQIRDLEGNVILAFNDAADWNSTFSISAGGTLSCYPCNKATRISANTGSVLTGAYWHHIKLVGNKAGIKLYTKDYKADGTLNEDYTIKGSDVSTTNKTPGSIALRPGSCGSVAIKSLTLSKETKTISTYAYTINYKLDGTTVKTTSGNATAGTIIYAASPFTEEGQKYYSADGATTSLTISAGDNTLDVPVRKAYNFNYSVVSSQGGVVNSGSGVEGESVTVGYPHYQLKNTSLYMAGANNKEYRTTIALDSDNKEANITYNANKEDVIFYSEAEDIAGLTEVTYGNVAIRASKAGAAMATENTTITTLAPGKYIINAGVFSSAKTPDFIIKIAAGSYTFEAPVTAVNASEVASAEFTLYKDTEVVLLSEAMGNNNALDYIYIQKTGDAPTSISCKVTDAGYATFTPEGDVEIPAGVEAFIVKSTNSENIYLTKIEETIKAGTGVILKAEEGNYDFNITTGAAEVEGNKLVGVTVDTALEADAAYILAKDTDEKAVFSLCSKGTLAAGKAYLPASAVSAAGSLKIVIDDEATAIEKVATQNSELKTQNLYNLAGQKVSADYKGIVIKNGKRIVVK